MSWLPKKSDSDCQCFTNELNELGTNSLRDDFIVVNSAGRPSFVNKTLKPRP